MKSQIFFKTLLLSMAVCASVHSSLSAQVSISVNVEKTVSAVTEFMKELKTDRVVATSVTGCVNQLTKQAKLVVATIDVPVTLKKYAENKDLSGFIVVGYQLMVVTAPENKVQYVIDLSKLTDGCLRIDEKRMVLQFIAPRPTLDESMIVIDLTNLDRTWVKGGAGPLKDAEINGMVDGMVKNEIRAEVIRQGKSRLSEMAASQAGKTVVEALVRKILSNDKIFGRLNWLKLEVLYEDEVQNSSASNS